MRAVRAKASARLDHLSRGSLHAADLLEPPLQVQLIETLDRQRRENADALRQHSVGIPECEADLRCGALSLGRIGNAPVCRHRVAGPPRAGLATRVVADGENKIERGRARLCKLVPRLRAKA